MGILTPHSVGRGCHLEPGGRAPFVSKRGHRSGRATTSNLSRLSARSGHRRSGHRRSGRGGGHAVRERRRGDDSRCRSDRAWLGRCRLGRPWASAGESAVASRRSRRRVPGQRCARRARTRRVVDHWPCCCSPRSPARRCGSRCDAAHGRRRGGWARRRDLRALRSRGDGVVLGKHGRSPDRRRGTSQHAGHRRHPDAQDDRPGGTGDPRGRRPGRDRAERQGRHRVGHDRVAVDASRPSLAVRPDRRVRRPWDRVRAGRLER